MGSGHAHHHDPHLDEQLKPPAAVRRALFGCAAALALLTVAGLVLLWPTGEGRAAITAINSTTTFVDGVIRSVTPEPCTSGGPGSEGLNLPESCAAIVFEATEGPDAGTLTEQPGFEIDPAAPLVVGEPVVLMRSELPGGPPVFNLSDRQRGNTLVWLVAVFAVAVVLLGRIRGVAALAGLGASLLVLLVFTLPALIDARNPLGVACVSAAAIAFLAVYLAHGVNERSTAALLGTLGALAITAVLSSLFVHLARFSGITSDEATFLRISGGIVDFRGLLLAGIVIGALGALDDMTVTQASTVWELRRADPDMSTARLFQAALRVGRDHVASTVNTLVLAYAGASLPLMILFSVSTGTLSDVANSEIVAVEIVRALVGSVGLVVAVPLTTWLAVAATRGAVRSDEPVSEET